MQRLLVVGWIVVAGAVNARAQTMSGGNIDLQAFRPALDSRGFVTVNASQILGHKEISFGLVTNWGFRVLEFEGARQGLSGEYRDGERTYTVANVITPNLQAAVGLYGRFEVGASVPFTIVSGDGSPDYAGTMTPNDDDDFGFSAQGLGDVGLHAKVRFLDTSRHRIGVAVVGSVYLPGVYEENRWLGENGPTAQPMLVVDKELGRLKLGANLGLRLRLGDAANRKFTDAGSPSMAGAPAVPGTGMTIVAPATEVPFGAAAAYSVVRQKFDVVGEVFGGVPIGGENYFPLEGVIGVKLYLAKNSFFMLGGGAGFLPTQAAGANPDARAFMGIVFEPSVGDRDGDGLKDDVDRCPSDPEDFDDFEDVDGCPELDNDRDKLNDEVDRCPNEPEDRDGIEDLDGCPEGGTLDRDGDGIADEVDRCPDDPEDKDGWQDADGCPDPDNDGDQILDVDDLCPDAAEDFDGFEDQEGCPDLDNDKDRILDKADACRDEPETYNGIADTDGCPDRKNVVRTEKSIDVLENIYFETDSAVIRPESYGILDAIAAALADWPDIRLIEIGGHADERGTDEHNLTLTQARSESVRKYLVDKGVDGKRLRAKGYGEGRPLDPRSNQEAWSKNRRVEFVIVTQ